MIFQTFLELLGQMAGFFVLILGIMWLIFGVYEAKRRGSVKKRKTEDWDMKVTKFLKVLTYLGIVLGIFCIISGVSGLMYNVPPSIAFLSGEVSIFTSALLIIFGILTLLKPLNDLPIASVVGLLAGSAVVARRSLCSHWIIYEPHSIFCYIIYNHLCDYCSHSKILYWRVNENFKIYIMASYSLHSCWILLNSRILSLSVRSFNRLSVLNLSFFYYF